MILKKALPLLLMYMIATQLMSQENTNKHDSLKSELKEREISNYKFSNFQPFGQGSLSNFISNISLSSAFNEGESGKIDFNYTDKKLLTIGIALNQKLDENSEEAIPIDLGGLSPGTTVEFTLQKLIWDPVLTEEDFKSFDDVRNEYSKSHIITDPRLITVMDIYSNCSKEELKKLTQIKFKKPVFINFKYSITKSQFSYATDSFNLAKIEENYITPSFSASVGLPLSKKLLNSDYLSLTYIYSINYKTGDEYDFIRPFGSSNNFYGQTLTFGKPLKKIDNRLSLEWRVNLKTKILNLAFAPTGIYGFNSKMAGLSVPIYFINGLDDEKSDKPKPLQGGVRLGYSTGFEGGKMSKFKDGFTAQLIISKPFELIPKQKE
jgi:hypothetical protein